jgi:hypothetical protein
VQEILARKRRALSPLCKGPESGTTQSEVGTAGQLQLEAEILGPSSFGCSDAWYSGARFLRGTMRRTCLL